MTEVKPNVTIRVNKDFYCQIKADVEQKKFDSIQSYFDNYFAQFAILSEKSSKLISENQQLKEENANLVEQNSELEEIKSKYEQAIEQLAELSEVQQKYENIKNQAISYKAAIDGSVQILLDKKYEELLKRILTKNKIESNSAFVEMLLDDLFIKVVGRPTYKY